MSLPLQVKLLRAIQERRVRPIGSTQEETVDVRINSATHKDLQKEVDAGRFRQDLFYRVNVIQLDDTALHIGDSLNRHALRHYAECTRTGHWPGHPTGVSEVGSGAPSLTTL